MNRNRWLVMWAGAVVALAVLLSVGWLTENLRGQRAFEAYRAALAARGETLDWAPFRPPPVAAADNFAQTPLFAPLFDYRVEPQTRHLIYARPGYDEELKSLFSWRNSMPRRTWRKAEFLDLAAWQRELRRDPHPAWPGPRALSEQPRGVPAEDLLFLLGRTAAELDEVRAALRRPHARFPVQDDEGWGAPLPHLAVLKAFSGAFQTKAIAELARGRAETAAEEVNACLGLADTLRSEPLLVSGLVRFALLEVAMQPLWEGVARHQWTPTQLEAFQRHLESINLVAEMAGRLRAERAWSLAAMDRFAQGRSVTSAELMEAFPAAGLLRQMPRGWVCQNQLEIARAFQDSLLPAYDPANRRVDLALARRLDAELQQRYAGFRPYAVLARMLVPSLERVSLKTAAAQATLDLAVTACALERFRAAQGAYPPALEALRPGYLERSPTDAATGESMRYRREGNGFVLYSTGPDGRDDGGRPWVDAAGHPKRGEPGGDWVWAVPDR